MTEPRKIGGKGGGRPTLIAALLVIQTFAAVFFVGDALSEFLADPESGHVWFEGMVTLALLGGAIFSALEMRRTLDHQRMQDAALATASGELGSVIERQFSAWKLTPAERDVAFLALKGFDVAEIAEMRKAAAGTVRAQLSGIYAKAGISGRAQFAAFFVEDLLTEGLAVRSHADAG